jgi:hypothetical protein
MFPVLGGKIIECQQYVAILLEAGNGFVVFGSVKLDEAIKRRLGILRSYFQGAFNADTENFRC